MPKKYEDIDVQELLDYEGAETAKMARFERIMQHRTIEAMNGLSGRLDDIIKELTVVTSTLIKVTGRLDGVTQTIHRVGQLAQAKADEAIAAGNQAGAAQAKQQSAMTWLTVALALCTLAYTGINAWVAVEMRRGNAIQANVATAAKDQADAAKEQAAAARESNELQKRQLSVHAAVPPAQAPSLAKPADTRSGKSGH